MHPRPDGKTCGPGKEFPIFSYGQHYGLASEAAAGALGFVLFGTGALPLKVAMLALWTAGVLFLFLAQSRLCREGGGLTRGREPALC